MVFSHFSSWKKVRSAGQVSADLPRHVSSWTPTACGQPRGSIEEEKDELLKREEQEELNSLWAVPVERRTHQQMQRITYLLLNRGAKKKRKKRRKKNLPKTSSSRGPARRQQRQWHVSGSPGDVLLRAVFPSVVVRPEMPCIMAGMDLRDSCSGLIKAGIYGYVAPRAVFPSHVMVADVVKSFDTVDRSILGLYFGSSCCLPDWFRKVCFSLS